MENLTEQHLQLENQKFTYEINLITESAKETDKGLEIEGIAVSATTSRNGIKYVAEEIESMKSMTGIPILDSHNQDTVEAIKGIVINDWFDESVKARMFRGLITDEKIAGMIKQGLINRVSIGAMAKELVKEVTKKAVSYVAKGLEVLELSLVAVAGVPTATFTHSMSEAFKIKEEEKANMSSEENKSDATLTEALKAQLQAENKLKEANEKMREMEEASKDTASKEELQTAITEKKGLEERLNAIEKEKHKEMAATLTEKLVALKLISEEDKKTELDKNEKLPKESLTALYERVKDMKTEEGDGEEDKASEAKKTAESKGKLKTVDSLEEVDGGDLIVERTREGLSFWKMPEEDLKITGEGNGVR